MRASIPPGATRSRKDPTTQRTNGDPRIRATSNMATSCVSAVPAAGLKMVALGQIDSMPTSSWIPSESARARSRCNDSASVGPSSRGSLKCTTSMPRAAQKSSTAIAESPCERRLNTSSPRRTGATPAIIGNPNPLSPAPGHDDIATVNSAGRGGPRRSRRQRRQDLNLSHATEVGTAVSGLRGGTRRERLSGRVPRKPSPT